MASFRQVYPIIRDNIKNALKNIRVEDLASLVSGTVTSVPLSFPLRGKEGQTGTYYLEYAKQTPALRQTNFPTGYDYFKLMDGPHTDGMRQVYAWVRVSDLNSTKEVSLVDETSRAFGNWMSNMTGGRRRSRRQKKQKKQTRRRRH